jgi:hypothetical protein
LKRRRSNYINLHISQQEKQLTNDPHTITNKTHRMIRNNNYSFGTLFERVGAAYTNEIFEAQGRKLKQFLLFLSVLNIRTVGLPAHVNVS